MDEAQHVSYILVAVALEQRVPNLLLDLQWELKGRKREETRRKG